MKSKNGSVDHDIGEHKIVDKSSEILKISMY